jgi:hypothetical protein
MVQEITAQFQPAAADGFPLRVFSFWRSLPGRERGTVVVNQPQSDRADGSAMNELVFRGRAPSRRCSSTSWRAIACEAAHQRLSPHVRLDASEYVTK